jgi:hypothetical protein
MRRRESTWMMAVLSVGVGLAAHVVLAGCAPEDPSRICAAINSPSSLMDTWRRGGPPWMDEVTGLVLRTWANATWSTTNQEALILLTDELSPEELFDASHRASPDLVMLLDEHQAWRFAMKHGYEQKRPARARVLEAHLECRARPSLEARFCPWTGLISMELSSACSQLQTHALPRALRDEGYAFALLELLDVLTYDREHLETSTGARVLWETLRDAAHLVDASKAAAAALEAATAQETPRPRRRASTETSP